MPPTENATIATAYSMMNNVMVWLIALTNQMKMDEVNKDSVTQHVKVELV